VGATFRRNGYGRTAERAVFGGGAAGGGAFWSLLAARTTRKITSATIRKLITVFRNCPYASTGAPVVWPPSAGVRLAIQADEQVLEVDVAEHHAMGGMMMSLTIDVTMAPNAPR